MDLGAKVLGRGRCRRGQEKCVIFRTMLGSRGGGVKIMGTPFSVTVFGGRAGAGTSDGSFSVPAGKVLEIWDITGYIRPDAAGSDIVYGPFVGTNLAGTSYLHTL